MARLILLFWIFCIGNGWASLAPTCEALIRRCEITHGMPLKLLSAISIAESGRKVGKTVVAWPWTVNANNTPYIFATKREAVQMVRKLQSTGIKSIDVGCMQVNLKQHPHAFKNLDEAFDPAANVAYAAKFLKEKKVHSGTWFHAVGHYHSSTKKYRLPYKARVLKIWGKVQGAPAIDRTEEDIPFFLRKIAVDLIAAQIDRHKGEFVENISAPSGRRLPVKISYGPYQGLNQQKGQRSKLYFYGMPKIRAGKPVMFKGNLTPFPKKRVKPINSSGKLIRLKHRVKSR